MTVPVHAQSSAANGPGEQLHEFLPSDGEVLTKGTTVTVSATVTLYPSPTEPVEYIGIIFVNGRRRSEDGQFDTVLTPLLPGSSENLNEALSWLVHVKGPKIMTVRLQLSGIGKSSQANFRFADLTRTYPVKCNPKAFVLFRLIERLFGCCS
jgi:hypothetical protein